MIQPPEFLVWLLDFFLSETDAPPQKEWSGPQCFDSAAGTTMLAIHMYNATFRSELS